MKGRLKRAAAGLAVGAVIVLGGGFASADYTDGDDSASADATVTYTISSFRAIELGGVSDVDFGTVRQGGTATETGPKIYYGTTWGPNDYIAAYLGSAIQYGVKLYVQAGIPSAPVDESVACSHPGDAETYVDVSAANSEATAVDIITGIDDCGQPDPVDGNAALTIGDTWATATTELTLDATNATDDGSGALATPVSGRTLTFLIDG